MIHPAVADAEAVLFDFDFTLADSSAGIITCINYALSKPESTEGGGWVSVLKRGALNLG